MIDDITWSALKGIERWAPLGAAPSSEVRGFRTLQSHTSDVYSPDLNPIENVFAKVKQRLRTLSCRTRDALWTAMQSVLDTVTATDAINCFGHCGYTLRSE